MPKIQNRGAILALLTVVYAFNFIDRQIVGVLAPFIQGELGLSGTQIGLLTGGLFAIFYTFVGIPIAGIVDNPRTLSIGGFKITFDRVTIIALSLGTWSFFTMVTGFASGFAALAVLRIGVAIGEAGCSPPSHALISDLYKPNERGKALGTYALGIPFGIMTAYFVNAFFVSGGTVDWRTAFMVVGFAGLPLAFLVKAVIPEPERGRMDEVKAKPVPFKEGLAQLAKVPSYWTMALGIAFSSFGSYSVSAFLMGYMVGIPNEMVGQFADIPLVPLLLGLGVGNAIFYSSGTYLGGAIADHFGKKNVGAYAFVPGITTTLAACFAALAWSTGSAVLFFSAISLHVFFLGFYLGPSFSVAQNLAGVSVRATSTAVFFFVLNLIALGLGPTFTGWLWDVFATGGASKLDALRMALYALSVPWTLSVVMFFVSAKLLPKDWAKTHGDQTLDDPVKAPMTASFDEEPSPST
ncbi:MAG: MFS transporter [Pseudomonadota bacterium]